TQARCVMSAWGIKVRFWVERDGRRVLGPGRVELLEHIDRHRSITAAAKQMDMSYRRAWELVRDMNDAAGVTLVEASTGGAGGAASAPPHGPAAGRWYKALAAQRAGTAAAVKLPADPLAAPDDRR